MIARAKRSVAIVGAGIAGLATAWRLALSGCVVTLFDRSDIPAPTEAASWAAAGMICARLEMQDARPELAAFALAAQAAWPGYAAAVGQASGMSAGYRTPGALHVSLGGSGHGHRAGEGVEAIDAERAQALEPTLARTVSSALWASGEGLIDPRALCIALEEACRRAAVSLWPNQTILAIEASPRAVTGLRVEQGTLPFDHIVLAAGAWSTRLLADAGIAAPRIRPIKGQTLSLSVTGTAPVPQRIVWTDEVYIVPQATGRVIIGATQEDVGFDRMLDHPGLDRLKAYAIEAVPCLADLPELDRAVGFRPAADDGLPVIGSVGVANLTLASGQFRNGILFAPLIAEAASQHVLEATVPALAQPFMPQRFSEVAA